MFQENLIRLVSERKITWYRLAVDADIDHSLLFRYRKGETKPRTDNLIKLANALNCSVGELLEVKQ